MKEVILLYATLDPDFPQIGGRSLDSVHATMESCQLRIAELKQDPYCKGYDFHTVPVQDRKRTAESDTDLIRLIDEFLKGRT